MLDFLIGSALGAIIFWIGSIAIYGVKYALDNTRENKRCERSKARLEKFNNERHIEGIGTKWVYDDNNELESIYIADDMVWNCEQGCVGIATYIPRENE